MSVRLFDPAAAGCFREVALSDVRRHEHDRVVWIDLLAPSRAEVQTIGQEFGFHPLAIEDATKRRQRPKVDIYTTHIFAVFYAIEPRPDRLIPDTHEIALFADNNVVVTVREREIDELSMAAKRWAEHRDDKRARLAAMLVYAIADSVVDGYFPCMDRIAEQIEDIEMRMFDGAGGGSLEEIFRLKRGLLELRRVIAPTRDVFNVFIRRELPVLGGETVVYFQDVYDHVIRITDTIDADRDVLSAAVDVHLSLASNRMNETVRTLTIASIVLMSAALIAGVYGMNFHYMPELTWHYGYFGALAGMVVVGGLELWFFRRIHWW